MHNQTNRAKGILVWGLVFVAFGLVAAVAGLVLLALVSGAVFIGRLVLSIGILLLGLGIARLVQYASIRRNPRVGRQMMISECDERLQLIRAKAGQRAFRISSALAIAVLMWASFASDVDLPTPSGDTLWFSLVVLVVVPFLVYIGSIVYEQIYG